MLLSRPFWFRRQPLRPRSRRSSGLEGLETRMLLSAAALVTTVRGDLSAANPALNTVTDGTLSDVCQQDAYTFTINAAQGGGNLNVGLVATSGTLAPRLTLARADGGVLIQSDSGAIAQHLEWLDVQQLIIQWRRRLRIEFPDQHIERLSGPVTRWILNNQQSGFHNDQFRCAGFRRRKPLLDRGRARFRFAAGRHLRRRTRSYARSVIPLPDR